MSATPLWLRLAPFIFVCLWSGGFTAVRLSLDYMEALTVQALRYGIIVAVLAPLALLLRLKLPNRATMKALVVMGLLVQSIYFAGCNLAQGHGVTAAGLALVIALNPILVALLSPWLAGEKVSARGWLGLLLGLAGCGTVILSGAAVRVQGWAGLGFACVALAGMVSGTLYEKRHGQPCHPIMANLVQFTVGLLFTLPLAAATESMHIRWDWGLVAPMAYLVLSNSLIATSLLLAMIRAGEAARVASLFFLVPPLAAIIAWVGLGEALPPIGWAGTALAAAGVALANARRRV